MPYQRTDDTVFKAIDNLVQTMPPKHIYNKLVQQSNEVSETPRDIKQIYNRKNIKKFHGGNEKRHSMNSADHIQTVLNMVNTHAMVKLVHIEKGEAPSVIIYSDEIMKDLLSTLKHHPKTVVGVDRTFNLGEVFVTTTVFKHPALLRKSTNEAPIFLGSVLIHTRGTYESYYPFFSHLDQKLRHISSPIFGSDDEKSLVKAIADCFHDAVLLRCTKHLKDNMTDHLKDSIGLAQQERPSAIFSKNGLSFSENEVVLAPWSSLHVDQ